MAEALEGPELEATLLHNALDGSVHIAAVRDAAPHGIDPVLPPGNCLARGPRVFDEKEPTSGFEHPEHLCERPPPYGSRTDGGALVRALSQYLESRIRRNQFLAVPDVAVAARVMMETIVTWAVHRYWDPSPQAIDDQVVEDTVVQFIVGGLVKDA